MDLDNLLVGNWLADSPGFSERKNKQKDHSTAPTMSHFVRDCTSGTVVKMEHSAQTSCGATSKDN
jgi:hypothetical protein